MPISLKSVPSQVNISSSIGGGSWERDIFGQVHQKEQTKKKSKKGNSQNQEADIIQQPGIVLEEISWSNFHQRKDQIGVLARKMNRLSSFDSCLPMGTPLITDASIIEGTKPVKP